MGGPFTVPAQQGVSPDYGSHERFDGIGIDPAAAGLAEGNSTDGAGGYFENITGHRSGVATATPWTGSWSTTNRPTRTPTGTINPSGAGTTYAATTLTDAGAAFGVSDANSGATVTYGANTVTDTARNNGNAWVAGNTAQYAGAVIVTATGHIGIIASVALGVATLVANWSGGTPAAGEAYRINPNVGHAGRQITSVAAGVRTTAKILYTIATVATFAAWSNGTPANGTPYTIGPNDVLGSHAQPPPAGPWVNGSFVPRGGGEFADNFYKAFVEESNTEDI